MPAKTQDIQPQDFPQNEYIESTDDDYSFEEMEADFEFTIYKLEPSNNQPGFTNLQLPPGISLPPNFQPSSTPQLNDLAKFGEGIKNFGAGSSNLANTSTQFPYAGIKRTPVQCKGKLDMPHRSFHKPGTVNAQARIKCQIPMKELKGEVKLSRVGIVTISSGIKTVYNRKNWTANAAMACDRVKREYRSSVHVTWKSPENVEPPTGEISFQKEASVEC